MTFEQDNDGRAPQGRQSEAAIHTFPGPRTDRSAKPARPGISRAYMAAWMMLALGAGLYLAALHFGDFSRDDAATEGKVVQTVPNQEIENLTRQLMAARQAQGTLDESISGLRDDIADLHDRIAGLTLADQVIVARVAAAEKGKPLSREALSDLVNKLSQASPEETSSMTAATVDAGMATSLVADDTAEEVPAKDDAQLSDTQAMAEAIAQAGASEQQAAEEQVAVVVPPDPVPAPKVESAPKVAAPAKTYGIELAISTSAEALRLNWDLLVERHGDKLGTLSPRAAAIQGDENMRLLAGPFASAAEAKRMCQKLQDANVACRSSDYSGNPL